jgi:hypothetical protein
MIKIIQNMPAGTIGVEAVGKVTDDDYRDVLLPAIGDALERNDVRLLYVLGEDFGSYSPGAVWADTKLWAQHLKAWQKIACFRRRLAGEQCQSVRLAHPR